MTPSGRYAKGVTAWVEHPVEGRVQVVHATPLVWSNYPFTRLQASVADSLPSLAHRSYGNARDYWFIAHMNPKIVCPDDVVAGDILHIPTSKIW